MTLLLDPENAERFTALRRAHFPPARNHLDAHVTLFHALPAAQLARVQTDLAMAARRAPFPLEVHRIRLLGRGVAFDLRSDELACLRRQLAAQWSDVLTRQDRAPHIPHITVQNKVAPEAARRLYEELSSTFAPVRVTACGLGLWRYLSGPWEAVRSYPFRAGQ